MDEKAVLFINEELAFFMGAVHTINYDGENGLIIPGRGTIVMGARGTFYERSWDWLIPVWVKFMNRMKELTLTDTDPVKANIELFNMFLNEGDIEGCYYTVSLAIKHQKTQGNIIYTDPHAEICDS